MKYKCLNKNMASGMRYLYIVRYWYVLQITWAYCMYRYYKNNCKLPFYTTNDHIHNSQIFVRTNPHKDWETSLTLMSEPFTKSLQKISFCEVFAR